MREIKRIKLDEEEIEICLKMEDGEEEIDPRLVIEENNNLDDTIELNIEDMDGKK